ncbi:MAG: ABC transporter ATP-binding protein [Bdellovibrionota bacterium]
MKAETAVSLRGVSKQFGEVLANDQIDLDIYEGEIHGLIGENGAGKSTIMKILYGFYQASAGDIFVWGEKRSITGPEDAIELGIGMVHQHFMLLEPMSVFENIVLGQEQTKCGIIDQKNARNKIQNLLHQYKLSMNLDEKIRNLPVGLQQQVEIIKVLFREAKILILDEPTAVLTPQETDNLFKVLTDLKKMGKTIVLITHKMKEILSITDRVTVFRSGKKIQTLETRNADESTLAQLMVGRKINKSYERQQIEHPKVVLNVENISYQPEDHKALLSDICFEIREGEILGVAGVMGNGQTELEGILSGLIRPTSGKIYLQSQRIDHRTNREIRKLGGSYYQSDQPLGHVPEDRHQMGMLLDWTATDNFLLGHSHEKNFRRGPLIDHSKLRDHAQTLMEKYDVSPKNPDLLAKHFSGGNQQKMVLARELGSSPRFALISQPTRGVDIGAIEFIHQEILLLREQRAAILLISADLDEILNLSDRILVLSDGKIRGIEIAGQTTREQLGLMMMGDRQA